MKKFLKVLASLSLWELCGRYPVTAGVLTLLGVGGIIAGSLTPPSITPQASTAFGQSQGAGTIANNALQFNGNAHGSMQFPGTAANSVFWYVEGSVDPNITGGNQNALGKSASGNGLVVSVEGTTLTFITQDGGVANTGSNWWLGLSPLSLSAKASATAGSGYLQGYYPWTANGGGCVRNPSGYYQAGTTALMYSDPGLMCSTSPTVDTTTISGNGTRQTGISATCAVVGGVAQVTFALSVAPALDPGSIFTTTGFTPSGFNSTNYAVLPSSSGTSLVATTGAASCPAPSGSGGSVLSGVSGGITLAAISTTAAFTNNNNIGITTVQGGQFCGVIGEYGADSATPGFQFAAFTDRSGNALPNSPTVVSWPNQGGAVSFTGYTITGAAAALQLNVSSMTSFSVSAASWGAGSGSLSGVNVVTFTTSAATGFAPGNEITVSGSNPSGYNGTYLVAQIVNSTQFVANPLSGPLGMPQALANPGSYVGSASLAGVIVPGMQVFGESGTGYILPFGTASGTGTGGAGTYAISNTQGTFTFTGTASASSTDLTVSGLGAGQNLAIGEAISGTNIAVGTVISGYGSTNNHYTLSLATTGAVSGTITGAGTLFSSGTPGVINAWHPFYNSAAPVFSGGSSIALTARTQASINDFINTAGGYNNLTPAQFSGWGGSLANIGDFYGVFPSSSNQPSTPALSSLCTKTTDFQQFASTNGLTVHSLYRLNDPGIWADSSVAQFTGSISGTALTISSTQSGSTSSMASGTVIAGDGITGCPAACPTISSGSGSSYILSASGGTVASEAMTAGNWNPAAPAVNNGFNGYISGSTLTVTDIASASKVAFTGSLSYPTNTFTGSIPNGSNVLTVSGNSNPVGTMDIGTVITWAGIPANTTIVADGTGTGNAGTYVLNWTNNTGSTINITTASRAGQIMYPSSVQLSATVLCSSATLAAGELVTDGGASITGPPLLVNGSDSHFACSSGSPYDVAPNYNAPFAGDASTVAVSTALTPGMYVLDNVTNTVTTPIKIIGYGSSTPGLCTSGAWGCGTYTILNPAGLTIGSSGSPAAFTATGASDGGAIAPGPALTINDPGPGLTFPVTNYGTSTGSLYLAGTYDVASLGGTPSGIQVLVSYTAQGSPITGCTPCNWGALSATIGGGKWSGSISGIPAGGPYYVSIRATNGTSYATLPSLIKVGLVFDVWGEGQLSAMFQGANGGWSNSTYNGVWGVNEGAANFTTAGIYDMGPALATNVYPAFTTMQSGDRWSITGGPGEGLPEGAASFAQTLQNVMGYPVTQSNWIRDGAGINVFSWGRTTQSQSVAKGDGSTTSFCSQSLFCSGTVSLGGPLFFNVAGQTGGQITAGTGGVSSSTLNITAVNAGALEPGEILSNPDGTPISGSPALLACTANCGSSNLMSGGTASTWTLSTAATIANGTALRADPAGGAPAPYYSPQTYSVALNTFAWGLIKAGTFSISVDGTVVCTDSQTFAWNIMSGNCTGAGISSSFVNYATGDYSVTFATPPASNAVITASWTQIVSPDGPGGGAIENVHNNLDYVGDGTSTGGALSSIYSRTPGGVSGHIYAATSNDVYQVYMNGFPMGAIGLTEQISQFYGSQIPSIFNGSLGVPYMSASIPFIAAPVWRADGPNSFTGPSIKNISQDAMGQEWAMAVATKSTFTGSISGTTLTLGGASTGPMWEGEVIGCATFSLGCAVAPGTYITGLLTGTWGASGSTYSISPSQTAGSTAMANALYYEGAGTPIYAGSGGDNTVLQPPGGINGSEGLSAHAGMGFAGGRRIGARWAALIYGGLTSPSNASSPTLDRTKADAVGCDAASIAGPCFDVGTTYQASATATWTGSVATITGGLAAHARPFVVGQALGCSGCNANLVITALSVPPTQSTAAGLGEVGQTFTITANSAIGGSGSGTLTGGCSGTSGTGSNCIDFAFSMNTTGATALATCGEDNINGTAPWYTVPNGICSSNGIGSLVHGFRIGTVQAMNGGATPNTQGLPGSVFDDGVDPMGGAFNQSAAFTCNIVAAKVVQCVKGANYAFNGGTHVLTVSLGQWASGSTFASYGDAERSTGRTASMIGNVGGQPFAFTPGSSYTPGVYTLNAGGCMTTTGASHNNYPMVDVTVDSTGSIVDVYGSSSADAIGFGMGANCQFLISSAITGSVTTTTLTVTSGVVASGQTINTASSPTITTCSSVVNGCFGNTGQPGVTQTWNLSPSSSGSPTTASWAAMGAGTGGVITAPPNGPIDGQYGMASTNTSTTMMGDLLYDNSGFPAGPLNPFFTDGDGGYFEPGLPVRAFGLFMGAAVSG